MRTASASCGGAAQDLLARRGAEQDLFVRHGVPPDVPPMARLFAAVGYRRNTQGLAGAVAATIDSMHPRLELRLPAPPDRRHRLGVRHAVRPAADGLLRLHGVGPLPAVRRALPAEPAAHLRQHAHRGRPHRPQHEPPAARGGGDDQARGQRRARTAASSPAARAPPAPSTSCSRSSAWPCRPPRARCVGDELRAVPGRREVRGVPPLPAVAAARGLRRALRASLQRSHLAAGPRDGRRGEPRGRRRRGPRAPRAPAAAARVPGPPAHRLVLGGLERHRHALAGARDREAAARATTPTPASTTRRARPTSRST